jgi:hypothetical protein
MQRYTFVEIEDYASQAVSLPEYQSSHVHYQYKTDTYQRSAEFCGWIGA